MARIILLRAYLLSTVPILLTALLVNGCAEVPNPAEDNNWALYGNEYNNQRYSQLVQINRNNVQNLKLAWRYRTHKKATFQTNPLVKNGVMYITTPYNDVIALDAVNGKEIWRYKHELRDYKYCCGPANRGAALSSGKVLIGTIDARLIALDQNSGEVLWDTPVTDPYTDNEENLESIIGAAELDGARKTGFSGPTVNMAPQVFEDMVYVGISGAGYGLHLEQDKDGQSVLSVGGISGDNHGLRGFIAAYNVNNGDEVWRWYPVPESGWEGNFVTETAYGVALNRDIEREKNDFSFYKDSWRLGGGSIFTTPALDPQRRLIFLGTGNPSPQMDDRTRPGDNLHTVSLVALNARTGKVVWTYQQVPHDRWGYDVASPPVLLDVEQDGGTIAAVAQASKLGWLFVHNRETGKLLYRSEVFSPQENLFAQPTADGVRVVPGTLGAISWTPVAFNPLQNTLYIPGIYQAANFYSRQIADNNSNEARSYSFFQQADEEDWGLLTAIDTTNGKIRWQKKTADPMVGGALTTAGDLLFTGEGNGAFNAYDSKTGKRLWHYKAEAGVNAPPITYAFNDTQYIAVAAGGNSLFGYETGDQILVFALDD